MKIEFRGNLSPKCKKEFKNACISSCVLYVIIILSLTTWGAVSSASLSEKVTSSIEFIKYMSYIMVPCGIIVLLMMKSFIFKSACFNNFKVKSLALLSPDSSSRYKDSRAELSS